MAPVTLPLTFQNSFWSQDYRTGLEVLYKQLDRGAAENSEIINFIKARAAAESAIANALTHPAQGGSAFAEEAGVSLHLAFRGLREESIAQGKAHEAIANELRSAIAEPFEKWATGYRERLRASRGNILDHSMLSYEIATSDVEKLKKDYQNKTRRADEAEDDVRFAPVAPPLAAGDKYTTSPNLGPKDQRQRRTPVRQPTMTERIQHRLKEFRLGANQPAEPAPNEVHFDADSEEKDRGTPKVDKGKGRADAPAPERMASPPPMSPPLPPARLQTNPLPPVPLPPMILAGLELPPAEVSALLKKAKEEMPLRAVRFPLLGEYQDAFSGEEFSTWLKEHVKGFDGSLDRAMFAAKELTEKYGLLRRLGELGNDFENAEDAYFQFRPKAFNLEEALAPPKQDQPILSPQKGLSPLAEQANRTTASFASLVSRALNTNANGVDPPHVKLRREAEIADREYRIAIRKLDRQRLELEERAEDTLKTLQRWELDRLRAVKTVLRQYHNAISKFGKAYEPSLQTSETLIAAYQPEADIKALIEQHRTGPFRPAPQVYESISHDESDVVFGIDLRRWADLGLWQGSPSGEEKRDEIPPVLTVLLAALTEVYSKLPNDLEKRKTWIYDVPLPAVHHLRETLNAVPPEQPLPADILSKYDAPVLAGAVKLWALELDPPLAMYEGWDEIRKLYPTIGSTKPEEQPSEEQHIQELQSALQKLPKIHLQVLDALVKHLHELLDATASADTEESSDVFVTKLGLTMGRTILRPKQENEFSIQDRHPALLFVDLVTKYAAILPPVLARKKRESDRKVPVRRRTRPVDMRLSRSRISAGADLKELHAQQLAQRTGMRSTPSTPDHLPPPSLPAIPQSPHGEVPGVTFSAEPESVDELPPPPPPTAAVPGATATPEPVDFSSVPPPPPLAPAPTRAQNLPPHPAFKEPPPELDDMPPRPNFKEPEPEPLSPQLPMPAFKDPLPEPISPPATTEASTPPPASPIPPALRAGSRGSSPAASPRQSSPRPSSLGGGSRSPSPVKPTSPALSGGSPAAAPVARGARVTRGPRPPGSPAASNVNSLVRNINRQSFSERSASPGANGTGNLSRNSSKTYGRGSVSGRVAEFQRRTMASDAEDEVVDK